MLSNNCKSNPANQKISKRKNRDNGSHEMTITRIPIGRIVFIAAVTALAVTTVSAAESPRERILIDANWRFHLGDAPDAGKQFDFPEVENLAKTRYHEAQMETELDPYLPGLIATNNDVSSDPPDNYGRDVSFVRPKFDDSAWRQLDLPHDWAVELPFDGTDNSKDLVGHGFKAVGPHYPKNSVGWYRKDFDLPKLDKGKILWLEFDGVYRNSLVWLNGHCLGRHPDGYTSFRYDISPFANYGAKNEIAVRVDATRYEGWFYEGAGIYRHVWLEKTSPLAVAPDGIFVSSKLKNNMPEGVGEIHIQAQLTNRAKTAAAKISFEIVDPSGKSIGRTEQSVAPTALSPVESVFYLCPAGTAIRMMYRPGDAAVFHSPLLWSPENPKLYRLITTVENDGKIVDRTETEFGIRTIAFDADRGFLLNGKPYTIKGTCNHQDHAGVGVALPDTLQYFRIRKLKEIGANAYRTSHNPPTPELLEACDRLGMLVMDENRRMDTNAVVLDDLKNFIVRDRNHPCVFIWSLGNEEPALQGSDDGQRVATVMQNLVHQLDPTRLCTVAMNGKWGLGFSKIIDVQGFNYGTKNIRAYHANHPAQPEIGTETASTVTTRGIYEGDKTNCYVSAYGDTHPGWGARPWEWWPFYATNAFASGGFVWTGFDYRGEPTPYKKWPATGSHFGLMDTCGFPKDIYYYYQSWWQDKPMLHIAPHWNWAGKEGQEIPVRVFSNCKEVELFLNGISLGKQTMQKNQFLDWKVAYAAGSLEAKGYNGDKSVIETKVETTGAPASIQLLPDRTTISANGRDLSIVNVAVLDALGRVVPTAENLIQFQISGGGRIIGVGNGDPSSHEADKADQRKLFNGWAQVMVQSSAQPGETRLSAASQGLRTASSKIEFE
jgi:beta-galactosidase